MVENGIKNKYSDSVGMGWWQFLAEEEGSAMRKPVVHVLKNRGLAWEIHAAARAVHVFWGHSTWEMEGDLNSNPIPTVPCPAHSLPSHYRRLCLCPMSLSNLLSR